jgi:exonuclease III
MRLRHRRQCHGAAELEPIRQRGGQSGPRALAKLLEKKWTDALRELHPDGPMYTFWSYWRKSETPACE